MPTNLITLTPGVNSEATPTLNQGTFQSSNQIRFAPSGLPQKLGGWAKYYATAIGSIIRALHAWEDLGGTTHLAVGATASLDVITGSVLQNITPQLTITNPHVSFTTIATSNIVQIQDIASNATIYDVIVLNTPVSVGGIILQGAYSVTTAVGPDTYDITAASPATGSVSSGGVVPQFTTVSGNSSVQVTFPNHGLIVGNTFAVNVATMVGGLNLFGFYSVNTVIDANNFTINASNQANASTNAFMNGGNAQIAYYIEPGPPPLGTGYGIGGYGRGGYGDGVPPPNTVGTPITAIDWTLDNWGGFLVACPANGPIFVWQPQGGFLVAQMIANAPIANTGIFVAMPAQILVAYGSSVLGVQDPLLLNWSNAGDYTVWVAAPTNSAGSFRIPRGSKIVRGMQGPQNGLIWTDLAVWSMSFIGQPGVFGFNELASGCGLIAKFGAITLGNTVYWMSQKSFFCLPGGGSVTPVPCSVWDFVFQNLDTNNTAKIRAAANSQFGEVTWHFPVIGGTGENTAYVKFTPQFSCWDYGMNSTIHVGRSAWIDQSVLGPPIGADPTNQIIYQHEISNDADGLAMTPTFTTGYAALSDGEDVMSIDAIYPDFKYGFLNGTQNATILLQLTYAQNTDQTPYQTVVYQVNSGQPPQPIRPMVRGRLISFTVSSNDLGTWWRMGGPRVRTAQDGRL